MGMSENGKIESFHVIWDRNILSSFIPKPKPLNIQQQFQARIKKKKLQSEWSLLGFQAWKPSARLEAQAILLLQLLKLTMLF